MDAKVRELLAKAKETALGAGRSAGKAASGLVSQAKRNIRVVELNSEIESAYKNLGKMLYAVHSGVEIPSDSIDEALMDIDAKKEEIAALRESIQKAKSDAICPVCGKYIGKKAVFCSSCGTKIERDGAEGEEKPDEDVKEVEVKVEDAVESAKEAAEEACEKAAEFVENVEEKAEDAAEKVEEKAETVFEAVVDAFKKEDNQ